MSRTGVGVVLLLAASLFLGAASGEVFFRLFLRTIPPLAMSAFSASAAHFVYLGYGIVLGVILFGWSLLIVLLSGFFARRPVPSVAKSA